MRHILVMPLHDPTGVLFPHLARIMPQLTELFAGGLVGITAATAQAQPAWTSWVEAQSFFRSLRHPAGVAVGDQFRALYTCAAADDRADTILHLCFIDRLAFALQTAHAPDFAADIRGVKHEGTPLIFQRSVGAWETHPRNYRDLEGMATTLGALLFGRPLDFAWCHFVAQAGQLREIMPHVQSHDLSMLAEMVLCVREVVHTQDVDWLAWEDPFIEGRALEQLKREREASRQEVRKRLGYVVPTLQMLHSIADAV
jgi:hypothetical protein